MNNTTLHALVAEQTLWSDRWQAIARSRVWFALLLAIGAFSSVVYPHPPLVAFGASAETTFKSKRAVLVAIIKQQLTDCIAV